MRPIIHESARGSRLHGTLLCLATALVGLGLCAWPIVLVAGVMSDPLGLARAPMSGIAASIAPRGTCFAVLVIASGLLKIVWPLALVAGVRGDAERSERPLALIVGCFAALAIAGPLSIAAGVIFAVGGATVAARKGVSVGC